MRLPVLFDDGHHTSKGSPGPRIPRNQRPRSQSIVSGSDDEDKSIVGTPTRVRPSPTKRQTARQTEAARATAEQARREIYAQNLFIELNREVFDDGLPSDTKLIWNKRLLTTAGRAKWNK